ncbi:hypothetical protein J2755_000661 [Methanohalophilus levihalophilus]|uniref:hypothetical protein n=1 Tax=Methanohalophilus levihalophilus TaxID=1431282 RepID=UPI001AE8B1C7|nr:hypothetical protein [Methanohalophilus levihalophilus]MBP2029741.1 hypothetical protein [Methanohalophilus levihalophilus]
MALQLTMEEAERWAELRNFSARSSRKTSPKRKAKALKLYHVFNGKKRRVCEEMHMSVVTLNNILKEEGIQ